eukprot:XP_014048743.1 PREDICTED: breast cancer metastasis-suppressor 1-like protein [Salmo salar]
MRRWKSIILNKRGAVQTRMTLRARPCQMMGIARVVQGEVESGRRETPGGDCRQGFGVPGPLENLQENMQIRTKVGGIYGGLCVQSVRNKYDCVNQAAFQHWEVSIAAGKSTFHRSTHVPGMQARHLLAKFAVLEPK